VIVDDGKLIAARGRGHAAWNTPLKL